MRSMAGLKKREPHRDAADAPGRLNRVFEGWVKAMPFRMMPFARLWEDDGLIRVEEFREDGTLVVRAELPGVDPEKDVELTVSDGMLHIEAERRGDKDREGRSYLRRELRYGALSRSLPLPGSMTKMDITAVCKEGVLEIRIPEPKQEHAKKIPIGTS
jgi:HSP20 family protein